VQSDTDEQNGMYIFRIFTKEFLLLEEKNVTINEDINSQDIV
jgi:hypothetical protein